MKAKHKLVEFSVNHPKLVILLSIIVTVAALLAVPQARIDTDPENMLRESEPVRLMHREIKDEFNLADFLVVGFVGSGRPVLTTDFAERLALLVERVEDLEGVVSEDIIAPSVVDDIYRNAEGALVVSSLGEPRKEIAGSQPTLAAKINENPVLAGKLASPDG
ncbi:MAG TPA: hypothetical protein VLB27_06710, partial [candidate division Zixibacteria bacterium]|nr:hypothetical protein [candidate division Zixibacteria bacterium]